MKKIWLVALLIVLTGCSTMTEKQPFPLKETESVLVRECRMVGKYPGPEGYRFWGPPPVLGDFKYRTALKAKEKGATHIYWRVVIDGFEGVTVGMAYDCSAVPWMMNNEEGAE
jgi:uncharacterized lipoprotein YmbA